LQTEVRPKRLFPGEERILSIPEMPYIFYRDTMQNFWGISRVDDEEGCGSIIVIGPCNEYETSINPLLPNMLTQLSRPFSIDSSMKQM
jgi:hypothetical protein